MSRRVLILGCGPAGLLAAHAATLLAHKPIIVSRKRPSQLFGCQYLHQAIPLDVWEEDPIEVDYQLRGTVEEYALKVYGPGNVPEQVSPAKFTGKHYAWDIRKTYAELWRKYEPLVHDVQLTANDIDGMLGYYQPDIVYTSIPLPLICADPAHDFRSTKCLAIGDAPEVGQRAPGIAPPNTVICDGTGNTGYYRASNVFGYQTVEYPGWRTRPPIAGVVDFFKPISNTCTCWPELKRIGRMGMWQKGVLAHDVFNQVWSDFGGAFTRSAHH